MCLGSETQTANLNVWKHRAKEVAGSTSKCTKICVKKTKNLFNPVPGPPVHHLLCFAAVDSSWATVWESLLE